MDFGSALMALFMFGVLKIAVMVLAGRLVLKMYQATYQAPLKKPWLLLPDEDKPEIRILWWSVALFAFSELVCGVEVYILMHSSPVIATAHALSSAGGMALFALGVMMHLDKKLIRYGEPRCRVNSICRGCTIDKAEGCKFRPTLLLVGTFVIFASIPPLTAATERMMADPRPYMLPFASWNAWYDAVAVPWMIDHAPGYDPTGVAYSLPPTQLIIEYRILPVLAACIAAVATFLLYKGQERRGLQVLALAVGVLGYSYFEVVLYAVTGDVILGSLGHELAEFWFLVAMAEFLRRSFPPEAAPAAAQGSGELS